jgi:CRISPR-associated endonuclease/helicase Cas3
MLRSNIVKVTTSKKSVVPPAGNTWESAYARPGQGSRPNQSLREHSANVANLAADFGAKFGMTESLRIAGFLHDLGKSSQEFQAYMLENSERVQHSIFGAKRVHAELASATPHIAELLGNVIAAHHSALYDNLSPDGDTPLQRRIDETELWSFAVDSDSSVIKAEFEATLAKMHNEDKAFGLSMLTKLAYSCLIDADRLDAFMFESGLDYTPPSLNWSKMKKNLEERLSEFSTQSEMGKFRKYVSDGCAEAGSRERGIFKLEVPTGGGKTLAGLRFAIEHAIEHGLERIIYVIPYLSILSQTAIEMRKALNVDENTVLEHHSGFLPDDREYYKLQTDRWDAPIILTTQVQFLESIFSARGSDIRKLHNMANSVIIFDEAQSLPLRCVHLFNSAVHFLHDVCGSTILLCTATQPLLDTVPRRLRFSENPSIINCPPLSERTKINNATRTGGYTYSELADFVLDKHESSTLVIVNTKGAAKSLCEELETCGILPLHLSTNMCASHRDAVIAELRKRLDENEPVLCISTQLIEAGVDISCECVIRDVAGLDSIFQAAGRCNRHGEFGEVKDVYVVNIAGQNLSKLPEIKIGTEKTMHLFAENCFDISKYYSHYFHARKNVMDYPIEGGSVYDLLSFNEQGKRAYLSRKDKQNATPPSMRSAIRSAADAFYVIDRGRTDIVVPYGDALALLSQYSEAFDNLEKCRILRELGKYSVSLYKYQMDELQRARALEEQNKIYVLSRGFYHDQRGVDLDGQHEFLCL